MTTSGFDADVREGAVATEVTAVANYVGGRWMPARTGETIDVLAPASGQVLARVQRSTAEDLDAAVAAARSALPGWRDTPVSTRARFVFALREQLAARSEELAASITREIGKTIGDARAEVARMLEMVEAATAAPTTMQGRNTEDVARGVDCETIRQPVGVCAAITPFNFPAMVPLWFLPFAIACGNTFVLKPSEQAPLTQQIVFDVLDGLGLPPGVVNLLNGGPDLGEAILDSPGIDAVSFVGSERVARQVYSRAAATGKRIQALSGAKNHMVVMPDAVLGPTVDSVLASAFGAAGQRCMAGSVVVTVGPVHEAFVELLAQRSRELVVGDPADDATDLGPVVSPAARERIEAAIAAGVDEGAAVLVDGRSEFGDNLGPTVLVDVDPAMTVARDELFGPVLSVVRAQSLDDAIAIVNGSRYGNGTTIFTESAAVVRRYRHEVQVGMVGVNIGVAAPVAFFPFSGWKASFFGDLHAHGTDAIEFYTRKKTLTSRFFSGEKSDAFFVDAGRR